ncbi:MAG: hypothetical protein Q9187_005877 [Circinaria calcarea]
MAARNRPRSGFVKEDREDAHEEKAMWEQIVRDLEKCKAVNDRAKEVSRLIIEKEEKMSKRDDPDFEHDAEPIADFFSSPVIERDR